MAQDDNTDGIPDTVEGMLQQLAGDDGIDIDGLRELGKGMGAMYNGALEETDNPVAAIALTGAWIAAVVQNPNE